MQLDPHVKAVFDDIVAHTPDIGPTPSGDVVHLHPGRSPQGRRWLAVAAAAIVVVGVGALVAIQRPDAETPDVAPATQPPSPGVETAAVAPGGMMLFDPLPETLANAVVTADPGPDPVAIPAAPERDWVLRWYTATMDQPELHPHLEVRAVSTNHPIEPLTVDDATAITVRGGDGWLYDDPFRSGRSVAFHDGETMFVLTGYQLSDDDLLLAAENTFLADSSSVGAVVDSAAVPAGLVERAVGTGFESQFLPLESQQHPSPMMHWGAGEISVFLQTITEDSALVPLHRLGYDTVTDTTVHDQPAFVTTIASQPTYVGVTWSQNGITYLLGSNGLVSDLAVDYANRLRLATSSEWSNLVDEFPSRDDLDPAIATDTTIVFEVPVTGVDAETESTTVRDDSATPTTSETPHLDGMITTFENLGTGESLTLIDTDGVTVMARYEPTTTAQYCVDLSLDGFTGPACGDREAWSDGQTTFGIPSLDRTHKLVGQIVPDSVNVVTTSDGRTITPVSNVWWDTTPIDSTTTYTLYTADGAPTEVPSPIDIDE
ncbi:MAG: hypothetical protein CL424_16840 [Acidimicrobiaceae bacterium]|nr:hypothetical protein [Acidimicrobiaceae bacterium]